MTTMVQFPKSGLNRDGVGRILTLLIFIGLLGGLLFLAAGRIDWVWGWVFVALFAGMIVLNGFVLVRKDPELINARGRSGVGTQGWDKILVWVAAGFWLAIPVVAGLDVRYGWSAPVMLSLHLLGALLLVLGNLISSSAILENHHFETTVRIQTDRGHQVITTGPYRIVRHPGYVGILLMMLATPLLLGTWWAYLPAGIICAMMIYRTAREDRLLQRELPGYTEYARRTRSRLLPGIW